MTANELAAAYFDKARARIRVLELLAELGAHSDVVREAQELVELALKGMLRWVGIDPPKWHDVGPVLLEQEDMFSAALRPSLPRLAAISLRLRKERETAFYGDIDLIPTQLYGPEDSQRAIAEARFVLDCVGQLERLHRPGAGD
ncbi:MAG: HEPN domain-containing protein [Burkholderiales bacterium]|nr:HEPN domain-containing protein [Burkholderiales bacterium]